MCGLCVVPLDRPPILHVGDDDTVRGAPGAASPRDLDPQPLLALHQVHLPDVAPLSWLQEVEVKLTTKKVH